jgi:hypothetical protein
MGWGIQAFAGSLLGNRQLFALGRLESVWPVDEEGFIAIVGKVVHGKTTGIALIQMIEKLQLLVETQPLVEKSRQLFNAAHNALAARNVRPWNIASGMSVLHFPNLIVILSTGGVQEDYGYFQKNGWSDENRLFLHRCFGGRESSRGAPGRRAKPADQGFRRWIWGQAGISGASP